jgi:hypothetical protein
MAAVCGVSFFSIALGQPNPIKTVPPSLVTIWKVEEGFLHFTETLTERVPAIKIRVFEVEGKKKEVPYTYFRISHKQVWKYVSLENSKVRTAGGKLLSEKDITNRLKEGTVALFSADGREIDEAYCKVLREDTILIIGKAE